MEQTKKKSSGFSSPLFMAVALIAASVGTGNIWRFPRVAASNGGAAFIIAYVVIMLFAVMPVMVGEHVIGRSTRKGLPGAFRDFMGSEKATWFGSFVQWIVVITIAYYTVVVAWIFYYLYLTLTGGVFVADKSALFDTVSNHNVVIVVVYILIQAFCAWGAYKGVKGIETSTKILLPTLLVCVIALAVRSLTLDGASAGLNFLFDLDPTDLLSSKVWLEALTQCLWSAGPGWGICIAYGVYAKKKSDVALATYVQGFGDMSIAMLAGIAIIPGLFACLGEEGALAACASGNNGLAFIALTGVFEQIPGGQAFAALFWLALICASISSIIAMYSIVVQPLADAGWTKKKSVTVMAVLTIVLGIPSCWSITIFNNQDFVVGMGMLIGAIFSCWAMYKYGAEKMRTKLINHPYNGLTMGKWWNFSVTIFCPVLAVIMFVWWCILSVGWNPDWYNPLGTYSLATLVVQLGVMSAIFAVFNKRIAASAGKRVFDGETYPDIVDNGFVD